MAPSKTVIPAQAGIYKHRRGDIYGFPHAREWRKTKRI